MLGRGLWLLACGGRATARGALRPTAPQARLAIRQFAYAGGGRRGNDEDDDDEEDDMEMSAEEVAKAAAEEARDPFGFRVLKQRLQEEEEDDEEAIYVHPIEMERAEEQLNRRGAAKVKRNVFGLDEVPQEMLDLWEKGVAPPNLLPPTIGNESAASVNPADLYWPATIQGELPEEDQLYPQKQEPLYSAQDVKDMQESDIGGVCTGRLQRRGKYPLLCYKIDLEQLHFTNVPLMSKFLSPSGQIKPRRLSGLCSKCQRHVATTVKRARHIGMLPHTMGVDIYKRIDVPPNSRDEEDDDGPLVITSTVGMRKVESVADRVSKVPSRTI